MENTALTAEQIAAMGPAEILALLNAKDDELSSAAQLLTEQSARIDQLAVGNPAAKPTVKVGDDTYTVVHGLRYKDVVYSPLMISQNADVAAALVKGNSSALVLQPAA